MLTDDEKWALITELSEFLKDIIYRSALARSELLIEQLEEKDPDFGFLYNGEDTVLITYEIRISSSLLESFIGKYRRRGIKKFTHEITFNLPKFLKKILRIQ